MTTSPAPAAELAAALLHHFDAHRRDMPWRETSDPYAIWVSEVMLQQTRVDTVVPYWEEWLERFPTVDALADAPLDDVLKRWEGLGYYSRARNLHRAARMVRERYDGQLPRTPEALRRLPGVGEYTAGAVASIAFGVATPAVDGNVRRVLARLYDLPSPTAAELRDRATALVPERRPGDFNQALMELGATVCTPRQPDCDACPVARWCEARREGVQEERPRRKRKRSIPEETVRTLVAISRNGAMLLVRRPEDGLLGGLWEFPAMPPRPEVAAAIGIEDGAPEAEADVALERVVHTFSHKRVTYRPFLVRVQPRRGGRDGAVTSPELPPDGVAWVPPEHLDRYALPVAQQKIAAAARACLAGGSAQPPVRSR